MNTNALVEAVVSKAAGIPGMRGTSPRPPDSIPAAPWTIVGSHSATIDGVVCRMTFPLRCFVERTQDADRVSATVNDLADAFVAAYWDGLTIGGTVAQAWITGWNTDLYTEIAGTEYQVIELTLSVLILNFSPHTP